jgi:hypothetical protein
MLEPGLGNVAVDEAVADYPCHMVYEPQTQDQTGYEGRARPKPEAILLVHLGEPAFFVSERIKETVHTGAVRRREGSIRLNRFGTIAIADVALIVVV